MRARAKQFSVEELRFFMSSCVEEAKKVHRSGMRWHREIPDGVTACRSRWKARVLLEKAYYWRELINKKIEHDAITAVVTPIE